MNRKSFLKKIGLGALAVAIAPKVIAEIKPAVEREGLIPFIRRTAPPLDLSGLKYVDLKRPAVGDLCVDWFGNEWIIKGKENRIGYGLPDMSIIILKPVRVRRDQYGMVPIRKRVSIVFFNRDYIITHHKYERRS